MMNLVKLNENFMKNFNGNSKIQKFNKNNPNNKKYKNTTKLKDMKYRI